MAIEMENRVRVKGQRELAGTTLPLWCNGKTGTVLRVEGEIAAVKLDGVSARELRFLVTELEAE